MQSVIFVHNTALHDLKSQMDDQRKPLVPNCVETIPLCYTNMYCLLNMISQRIDLRPCSRKYTKPNPENSSA